MFYSGIGEGIFFYDNAAEAKTLNIYRRKRNLQDFKSYQMVVQGFSLLTSRNYGGGGGGERERERERDRERER